MGRPRAWDGSEESGAPPRKVRLHGSKEDVVGPGPRGSVAGGSVHYPLVGSGGLRGSVCVPSAGEEVEGRYLNGFRRQCEFYRFRSTVGPRGRETGTLWVDGVRDPTQGCGRDRGRLAAREGCSGPEQRPPVLGDLSEDDDDKQVERVRLPFEGFRPATDRVEMTWRRVLVTPGWRYPCRRPRPRRLCGWDGPGDPLSSGHGPSSRVRRPRRESVPPGFSVNAVYLHCSGPRGCTSVTTPRSQPTTVGSVLSSLLFR